MPCNYHALVVFLTFAILIIASGVRSTPGILTVQLERETGWERGVISGAIAINTLLPGLLGPLVVVVISIVGLRRVVVTSLLCLGSGVALSSLMVSEDAGPALLYVLWGLLVGVGSAGVATVLGAVVADAWFVERRSTVMGLFAASNAAGSLVFATPIAQVAVSFGWRASVWLMGAAALALVPLVLCCLADRPGDVGLTRYGEAPATEEADGAVRVVTRSPSATPAGAVRTALAALVEGARNRDFCLLAVSFAVCGASTNGLILPHFVPAAVDAGLSQVRAAGMLTAMGALDVIGTLTSGVLTERFDARALLVVYYGLRGGALVFLPTALRLPSQDAGMWPFAVVYGLDWIATVPPTKRLCDQLFPGRGSLFFGWTLVLHQVGAAIVAAVGGAVRDRSGTYDNVFYASATLCLVTAAAVGCIRSDTSRVKERQSDTACVGSDPVEPPITLVEEGDVRSGN